jgi:hypothetical protein
MTCGSVFPALHGQHGSVWSPQLGCTCVPALALQHEDEEVLRAVPQACLTSAV